METLEHWKKIVSKVCANNFWKLLNRPPWHLVPCLQSFFNTRVGFFILFLGLWKFCFWVRLMWPGVILYSYLWQMKNTQSVTVSPALSSVLLYSCQSEGRRTDKVLGRSVPDLRLVNGTSGYLRLSKRLYGSIAPLRLHVGRGTITCQGHGCARKVGVF